ncbi:hypothetical protein WMY93_008800 [Mugilogobius chulae]|uniref:Uncharacterized protein n=1 Tax=Mugilogobius chulae TaxID=88201 RepID=A0AAW0PIM4_9GOBI
MQWLGLRFWTELPCFLWASHINPEHAHFILQDPWFQPGAASPGSETRQLDIRTVLDGLAGEEMSAVILALTQPGNRTRTGGDCVWIRQPHSLSREILKRAEKDQSELQQNTCFHNLQKM